MSCVWLSFIVRSEGDLGSAGQEDLQAMQQIRRYEGQKMFRR